MPTLKKYEPLFYFCFSIWLQTDSNNTRLNLAQAFQSYDNPKANYMFSLLTGVLRVRTLNSITLVECQVFRKEGKKKKNQVIFICILTDANNFNKTKVLPGTLCTQEPHSSFILTSKIKPNEKLPLIYGKGKGNIIFYLISKLLWSQ